MTKKINGRTLEIMQVAQVGADEAELIQDFIDSWLELDWSEATQRQVNFTIRQAKRMINAHEFADLVKYTKENCK